ncbi:MAG: FkbM family methyltransferase [Verrucomicrobiales bacterium]|jgi:FkbM family methyltransferase|nr:FkbM family methyltransferase [Verrucomicrobiales bacterium]
MQDSLRKWHYERKLRSAQWTDEAELGAVKSLVRPGEVVFDIGANFGMFTRFLSETVGSEGKVVSFEPTRDMFLVLESNCKALGLRNVSCQNLALSESPGRASLRIPKREDGTLNHYEATLVPQQAGESTDSEEVLNSVELQSVDSFCESNGIDEIHFIKCDVEGHEIAVLKGAEKMIRKCHPEILIEINEPLEDGAHGSEVRDLVISLGYDIQIYENEQIRPRRKGETRVNYVLTPSRKAAPTPVPA